MDQHHVLQTEGGGAGKWEAFGGIHNQAFSPTVLFSMSSLWSFCSIGLGMGQQILVCILGVWFRPSLQLEQNWLEVLAKVEAQVGTWLRRHLSLKGQAEVCAVYIFLLIFLQLSVLPLPKSHQLVLTQSLSKLLWSGWKLMVHRQVCYQRPQNGD